MNDSIFSLQQLRDQGLTRHAIVKLVTAGALRRVRRGWYATPDADPGLTRAISVGARVGCLTGCIHHGLWVPPHVGGVHAVYGAGSRVEARGLTLHPSDRRLPEAAVWLVLDCLEHVLRRHDAESFLVVAESAIDQKKVHLADVKALIAGGPARRVGLADYLSWAQSGSETRVRLFLQQRRIPVASQVDIPGVGRVDLLVGNSLIIECDSERHHSTPEARERDKRRDLAARALGYDRIRLSYSQIWDDWPQTAKIILATTRKGRHLRAPRALSA